MEVYEQRYLVSFSAWRAEVLDQLHNFRPVSLVHFLLGNDLLLFGLSLVLVCFDLLDDFFFQKFKAINQILVLTLNSLEILQNSVHHVCVSVLPQSLSP